MNEQGLQSRPRSLVGQLTVRHPLRMLGQKIAQRAATELDFKSVHVPWFSPDRQNPLQRHTCDSALALGAMLRIQWLSITRRQPRHEIARMTTQAAPTGAPRQSRRRWLRWLLVLLLLFFGLPIGYYFCARWSLECELAEVIAQTDRLDPRWRLE